MKLRPALLLIALPLIAPASAQSVLDVDRNLGPYTTIQSAVDAASPGDVIRVSEPGGIYEQVTLDGMGISIVAAPGNSPSLPAIEIKNLPADQTVVLAGLRISDYEGPYRTLVIEDCAGPVRIIDCSISGDMLTGASLDDALDVTFHHSDITGVSGLYDEGMDGMWVSNTQLTLWNCEVTGANSWYDAPGGHGIYAYNSEILLHGCSISGGTGSRSYIGKFGCQGARPGGSGVTASSLSTLRFLDTLPEPGQGGAGSTCSGPAEDGRIVWGDATVIRLPGEALDLESPYIAAEGSSVTISATGMPGDTILLGVGPATRAQHLPAYIGELYVSGAAGTPRRFLMGTGPSAELTLTMPELPPMGMEQLYLQSLHLRGGQVVAGPVRPLLVLDAGW